MKNIGLKKEHIVLSIIILCALALRIYLSFIFYGTCSDEFANIAITRQNFESGFRSYCHLFMWFYYFISASLLFIVKDAYLAAKLVTIFFGTATFLIVYLIVRKIFDKKTALMSILMLAINPEFTIISSTPLREPVYTFFVFLSIFFIVNQKILTGALSVSLAFLTRMEGLLIDMPSYMISLIFQNIPKKILKISFTLIIFVSAILFMNMWVPKPFIYLTETFRNQGIQDHETVKFVYTGLYQLIIRIKDTFFIYFKYLFTLMGPNIIFFAIGAFLLLKNNKKETRIFTIYAIFHIFFWVIYIFIFKKILFDFYRYLYPVIPFCIILIVYGFLRLYEVKRIKILLVVLLVANIIAGYLVYYNNNGRRYLMTSRSHKEIIKASLWVEENIPEKAKYKVLIGGTPEFYLFRRHNKFNLKIWWQLSPDLSYIGLNDLFNFIKKENIKYVVWQNDNANCLIAPYLSNFEKAENESGRLMPLVKFEGPYFKALIYKFENKI